MHVLTEIEDFPGFALAPLARSRIAPGDRRIADAVALILKVGGNRVGFLGLACRTSPDGSHESPILEVMTRLADKGLEVAAFDPAIYTLTDQSSLSRADSLCANADDLIDWCETLVVTYHSRDLQASIAARRGRCGLIDLVDLFAEQTRMSVRPAGVTRCRFSQKSH